ncbi:hypothetical protein AQS8620_01638 [Aquimixticola soesokkakensis]|uniref:Uncharacterized protein n=1 Tax=Aquimixticola soesokkakensis TaxID=1519096 RepID=A0A1Y5SNI6_9RHOB|nr:hypothetical protein [Aquimixticola soesokkakensis]SLN41789.1 hypothetical protein AQS8620_01638 [Aquimixticola soesokkakensis]
MNPMHLLRAARWARKPPSAKRVKLVLGVVAICLVLVAIEHVVGWPEALTIESPRKPVLPR